MITSVSCLDYLFFGDFGDGRFKFSREFLGNQKKSKKESFIDGIVTGLLEVSFLPKRKVVFQPSFFRDYVKLRGSRGIFCLMYIYIYSFSNNHGVENGYI